VPAGDAAFLAALGLRAIAPRFARLPLCGCQLRVRARLRVPAAACAARELRLAAAGRGNFNISAMLVRCALDGACHG